MSDLIFGCIIGAGMMLTLLFLLMVLIGITAD